MGKPGLAAQDWQVIARMKAQERAAAVPHTEGLEAQVVCPLEEKAATRKTDQICPQLRWEAVDMAATVAAVVENAQDAIPTTRVVTRVGAQAVAAQALQATTAALASRLFCIRCIGGVNTHGNVLRGRFTGHYSHYCGVAG